MTILMAAVILLCLLFIIVFFLLLVVLLSSLRLRFADIAVWVSDLSCGPAQTRRSWRGGRAGGVENGQSLFLSTSLLLLLRLQLLLLLLLVLLLLPLLRVLLLLLLFTDFGRSMQSLHSLVSA